MREKIVNALCVVVLIAGALVVVTDGIMGLFGAVRGWQYAFNAAYLLVVVPGCIGVSKFARRMRPDLWMKEGEI